MNIVWQQPNGAISVTSIFDGSDPQEHAYLLKEQGNISSDWVAVAYNHADFPDTIQEAWWWNGNQILVDFDILKAHKLSRYNASAIQTAQARQMNALTGIANLVSDTDFLAMLTANRASIASATTTAQLSAVANQE